MVTAYELRHLANNYQLSNLLQQLKEKAEEGRYSFQIGYLSDKDEQSLIDRGFKVEYTKPQVINISW